MLNKNDYLTIFHEIKNSITLIGSSLQLLEKKHPQVQEFDYWNESMAEIAFLKKIVTELSANRLSDSLHFSQVSLPEFFSEISCSLRSLSWKNFFCEVSLEENLPVVEMDSVKIRQAIINLLKNSCEAMNYRGTVQLHAMQDKSYVIFDITDYGGGIPAEYESHMFEALFTSKKEGSGLGLLITQNIVESHNGSLSYVSRPGDGCTFTIRLPIHQS